MLHPSISLAPRLSRACLAAWLLGATGAMAQSQVEVRQTSVPVGIVNQTGMVNQGSTQKTVTAPETSGEFTWAYWTINAARWADLSGAAGNPAEYVATGNVDAVALFLPTNEDADGDGLLDYWEQRYFGNLTETSATDPDGDGFSNADEVTRGLHPRLANTMAHGGITRRRSNSFTVIQDRARYALLTERSQPAGVVHQSRVVEIGVPVNLATPPDSTSGWMFTGWLRDGLRWDNGADWQPRSFTPEGDTTFVARYTLATEDADADAFLDWKELRWFDSLQYSGLSDPDMDGFSINDEEARGFSFVRPNELAHGGLTRRRSTSFFVDTTGRLPYRQQSDPATILDQTEYLPAGTLVAVPDRKNQSASGYLFSWWDLNGVRQSDASGAAVTAFSFILNTPSTATGHYVDPNIDTDGDGIKDWQEWTYYGSLAYDAASDTDSDGFDFATELSRTFSPLLPNTLAHGGISRRRGASFFVDTTGRLPFQTSSRPETILNSLEYLPAGTMVTVPNRAGQSTANYLFSWYDLNGLRIQDPSGVALTGFNFTLNTASHLVGNYIDPNIDTDGDGIKDWHEWSYYGGLEYGPADDTDGDGFGYVEEITRTQSPRVGNELAHGGITRRRSVMFAVDPIVSSDVPLVGDLFATSISATTAQLNAKINPMSAPTTAKFSYGDTPALGFEVVSESILNGFISETMSATVGGLLPDTLYYFRVTATNNLGTTVSQLGTFRTLPLLTPFDVWRRAIGLGEAYEDDDGDGLNNLIEYAFGLNPKWRGDAGLLPELARIEYINGRFWMSYSQPLGVQGIRYRAQYSLDLVHWFDLPNLSPYSLAGEFWTKEEHVSEARVFVRWNLSEN